MKNILNIAMVTIGLFVCILGVYIVLTEPDQKTVIQQVKTTKYDVTMACEYFSSRSTNENWSYKDCLGNLEAALKNDYMQGGVVEIK